MLLKVLLEKLGIEKKAFADKNNVSKQKINERIKAGWIVRAVDNKLEMYNPKYIKEFVLTDDIDKLALNNLTKKSATVNGDEAAQILVDKI